MDEQRQVIKENYALYHGDCIEVSRRLPSESIGFSIYSPPFYSNSALYNYSSSERDLSNARDFGDFITHYDFVIQEVERITMPGRLTAVHCMDTPLSNSGHGDSIMDFPGMIVEQHVMCRQPDCTEPQWKRRRGMCGHGWFDLNAKYHIWQEPLFVRNSKMQKKLNHSTIVADSSKCGVAGAGYLYAFRKKGTNPESITHEHGLTNYAGATPMPADTLKYRNWQGKQIENKYSQLIWQRYASCCWGDVRRDNVLPYKMARSEHDEKHVHPLQLDVIERAIVLYSNSGDTIWEPFMGVGSVPYQAVKMRRRAVAAELKDTYFRQAVNNLAMCVPCEDDERQITMFDLLPG